MCSNSALIDSLECYMDELVDSFEDFVKKSLCTLTLGVCTVIAMFVFMVRKLSERSSTDTRTGYQSGTHTSSYALTDRGYQNETPTDSYRNTDRGYQNGTHTNSYRNTDRGNQNWTHTSSDTHSERGSIYSQKEANNRIAHRTSSTSSSLTNLQASPSLQNNQNHIKESRMKNQKTQLSELSLLNYDAKTTQNDSSNEKKSVSVNAIVPISPDLTEENSRGAGVACCSKKCSLVSRICPNSMSRISIPSQPIDPCFRRPTSPKLCNNMIRRSSCCSMCCHKDKKCT